MIMTDWLKWIDLKSGANNFGSFITVVFIFPPGNQFASSPGFSYAPTEPSVRLTRVTTSQPVPIALKLVALERFCRGTSKSERIDSRSTYKFYVPG